MKTKRTHQCSDCKLLSSLRREFCSWIFEAKREEFFPLLMFGLGWDA